MPTETNWGIIAVSGVFAVIAIGVALTSVIGKDDIQGIVAPAPAPTVSEGDWKGALLAIVPAQNSTSSPYRAPKELSPTQAFGREMFAGYIEAKSDGKLTAAEQDKLIQGILERNVKPVSPSANYTLGSLRTSDTASIEQYTVTLLTTLRESEKVQEYEITTFSRTVGQNNFNGTPELQAAGSLYKEIENSLAKMQVPTTLAAEHLELLRGVSFLAESTRLMGTWSGDPILALAYLDAFNRAERQVQVATSNLFFKISKSGKSS